MLAGAATTQTINPPMKLANIVSIEDGSNGNGNGNGDVNRVESVEVEVEVDSVEGVVVRPGAAARIEMNSKYIASRSGNADENKDTSR